jgi:hypothetical protein
MWPTSFLTEKIESEIIAVADRCTRMHNAQYEARRPDRENMEGVATATSTVACSGLDVGLTRKGF